MFLTHVFSKWPRSSKIKYWNELKCLRRTKEQPANTEHEIARPNRNKNNLHTQKNVCSIDDTIFHASPNGNHTWLDSPWIKYITNIEKDKCLLENQVKNKMPERKKTLFDFKWEKCHDMFVFIFIPNGKWYVCMQYVIDSIIGHKINSHSGFETFWLLEPLSVAKRFCCRSIHKQNTVHDFKSQTIYYFFEIEILVKAINKLDLKESNISFVNNWLPVVISK